MASDLAAQLRAGRSLGPSRGRVMLLCGLLAVLGGLLLLLAGSSDYELLVLGAFAAGAGAVMFVLSALGWTARRAVWLAREGIVFEKPGYSYHVPWDEISAVTLAGWSLIKRVQVTVRDVEAVVATVRRKRRGGKLQAQRWVRRLLTLNKRVGKECHLEFMAVGIGVDAAALAEVLVGYMAEASSRERLRPLPVLGDSSDG